MKWLLNKNIIFECILDRTNCLLFDVIQTSQKMMHLTVIVVHVFIVVVTFFM
jgi:hypothetical protein